MVDATPSFDILARSKLATALAGSNFTTVTAMLRKPGFLEDVFDRSALTP